MLAHERGYVVGLPACPLAELYRQLPVKDVRLNTRVEDILFDSAAPARALGVTLRDGQQLRADALVLATNHHAVQRWIPRRPPNPRLAFPGH